MHSYVVDPNISLYTDATHANPYIVNEPTEILDFLKFWRSDTEKLEFLKKDKKVNAKKLQEYRDKYDKYSNNAGRKDLPSYVKNEYVKETKKLSKKMQNCRKRKKVWKHKYKVCRTRAKNAANSIPAILKYIL